MTDKLPPGVEAAWGLRERPAKGPKSGLSRERIVATAIAMARAGGLEAVSMPRLAKELGTAPMSLYRHVASKDELIALMRDTAFGPPPDEPPSSGWRAGLADWAEQLLAAYRHDIWTARMPVTGLPIMPNELAWTERALVATADTGLGTEQRMSILLTLSGYVRIVAQLEGEVAAAMQKAGQLPDEWMFEYSELLRRLVDPVDFPNLTEVMESRVMDKADDIHDEFSFGLARILDGVGVLIDGG